jgi:phosphoribosyl 1,2-cyclic phosphodiesterase
MLLPLQYGEASYSSIPNETLAVTANAIPPPLPTPAAASGLSVSFWGVRGSAPVFGANHQVFGGNTMCLEISAGERRVIVDAGTGIRQLGRKLQQDKVSITDIMLTHYHMDHLMGLMTFAPLFEKSATVTIHAPILDKRHPETILHGLLDAPFFPMAVKDAGASFAIHGFHPGEAFALADLDIRTTCLPHPGGACGYRIGHDAGSVAVIMDYEHASDRPDASLVRFCSGSDLILYDAHWDDNVDYLAHRGWGHSTWQAGLRLMHEAGVRRLGAVHHAPGATDDTLLEREGRLRKAHPASFFAREGETLRF